MNTITEYITEILKICGEKKIEFTLEKNEGTNFIKYEPKNRLIINISDPNDKNLLIMLNDELKILKNFVE